MTVIVPGGRLSMPGARASALSWPSGGVIYSAVIAVHATGPTVPNVLEFRQWRASIWAFSANFSGDPTGFNLSSSWTYDASSYVSGDYTPGSGSDPLIATNSNTVITTNCTSPTTPAEIDVTDADYICRTFLQDTNNAAAGSWYGWAMDEMPDTHTIDGNVFLLDESLCGRSALSNPNYTYYASHSTYGIYTAA